MIQNYELTDEQKRLRENWLKWTIFVRLIWPVLYLCTAVFMLPSDQTLDIAKFFSTLFGTLLGSLLFFIAIYKCAYKKPGTRLLFFVVIITPLALLKEMADLLFHSNNLMLWSYLPEILNLGLGIWWYKLTLEFRKLNDQINKAYPKPVETTGSKVV